MRFFATPPVDGAFAELVTVHEQFAHPVPDSLSDDAAALLEPLSVGLWACRKGGVGAGSRVLVTGAGPVGLVAVQAALALGAASVVVTDVDPHRLALARELGATEALDVGATPVSGRGRAVDVLLECSGHPGATADAIRAVAPAGRVVLVGMGGDEMALPVSRIQERELDGDRHLPLRPHLAGRDRAGGLRPGAARPAGHRHYGLDRVARGAHRRPHRPAHGQAGRPAGPSVG